jgi:membrane-bound lytic murein transglycosylase D
MLVGILSANLRGENVDTIKIDDDEVVINFEENLDSLLNLCYVQQALSLSGEDSMYIMETDSLMPDYPDSVYIDRISRLPFVMNMSYYRIVKNYIDVYAKKRPDKVRVMLSLANYYFPIFEQILDQFGLPDELKYLSVIESALNPRAVSRAGATGMWQFMHYTGKLYGLTINSLVDERKNPIKSTYAAATFLKDLYDIYKDWTLVIAAYNCGPGNVNKAIRRSGGKTNCSLWKFKERIEL